MDLARDETSEIENKAYRKSMDLLSDHVRKVQDAVRELVISFDDYLSGNTKNLKGKYERISCLEEEADLLKMELIDQLTKAAPGMLYREDFLRLAVNADEIAELAQSTARLLNRLAENQWIPDGSIAQKMRQMASEVLTSFEKLRDAVISLLLNPKRAIQLVVEVHAAEAVVDETYQDLDFMVLMEVKQYERLLVFRDLLSLLEHMADVIEDTSNDVRILALHRVY